MPSPLKFPIERVVLLLHGFPDDNSTFQPLCSFLSKNGYRCLAPALPGYAPMDDGIDCSISSLSGWVFDYLDRQLIPEGVDIHIIGHDWGSVIAQHCLSSRPGFFTSAVLLSVPVSMFENAIIAIPSGSKQLLNSWYMVFFQLPFLPELWLTRNDGLQYLLTSWSPTWNPTSYSYVRRLASIRATLGSPSTASRALSYYRLNIGVNFLVRLALLTIYLPLLSIALLNASLPSLGVPSPLSPVCRLVASLVARLHPLASRYDSSLWPPVLAISGVDDGCVESELFGVETASGEQEGKGGGGGGKGKGTRVTIKLEGCGHWPHVEKEEIVRAHVLKHLQANVKNDKRKATSR